MLLFFECDNQEAGISVAFSWSQADVKNYQTILATCLNYIQTCGGAVLKYPFTGGMGAVSPHPMETPELIEMA